MFAVPPIETGRDLSTIARRVDPATEEGRVAEHQLDTGLRSSQPVGFPSILNIGWAVLLTQHSNLLIKTSGTRNEDCQKLEHIHRLLIKAVELSEAIRTWRSNGDSHGSVVGTGD